MARWLLLSSLILAVSPASAAMAGWPFFAEDDGPEPWSEEWYALRAADPPGARQHFKYGKAWPPFPRPVGPHQTFWHKYHHTHYWPHPYTCMDRAVVQSFVDVQTTNGWLEASTLYDYHFDGLTNELNSSGKAHLRWIMTHVPEQYRQILVATDAEPSVTAQRTAQVEQEMHRQFGSEKGIPVLTRLANPVGRPASEVQAIFQSARENMPPPMLSTLSAEASDTQ
jgi:hypothetical protein